MTGLTRKCHYALRALHVLAVEYGKGPILMHHIASRANAPADFLQMILIELKKADILGSRRGAQGGYYLLKPPELLTVGSIVRLIDGPLVASPCLGQGAMSPCRDCPDSSACLTALLLREVEKAVSNIMDGANLLTSQAPMASEREAVLSA